ncbi:MAG: hypothetical protein Q8R04_04455 [Nanoarchaeota archaeon]|nr:hypothetical protein [Nanoarchaeota archaeon]
MSDIQIAIKAPNLEETIAYEAVCKLTGALYPSSIMDIKKARGLIAVIPDGTVIGGIFIV